MILNDNRKLTVSGWSPVFIADITMFKLESGNIQFELESGSVQMKAEAAPIFINNFSAYLKGD